MAKTPHILIVGGGYVGMYTAYRLQKKVARRLGGAKATITIVDPQSHMTYQPFLPEAAAGSVEPRHVVVPLRRVLRRCRVITGMITTVDHAGRTATIRPIEGDPYELGYDVLVMAPGSVARTLPIPGLAEQGIGFKNIGEAIYLRNQVLSRLDFASSTPDSAMRARALSFCLIGGGYAGIELLGELEDMARYACKYYEGVEPADLRWVLVEAAGRILPEVSLPMGDYTVRQLLKRGIDVRLNTRVVSLVGGHVVLSDGEEFDSDTIVWTAGVKAHPLLANTDLPRDAKGRLVCDATLAVSGTANAWGAGDCAAVPDLSKKDDPEATTGPSAQHAVRQAKRLADNIARSLRGQQAKPYVHAYVGSVASLGLHKGVAEVYGIKLRGWLAWFMHRSYHVSRMPTFNRKVRVVADWTLGLFFPRDIVALGQIQQPRRDFAEAALPEPVPSAKLPQGA
jgi:NADH:ubiquinone reductase (H+-translocating)